MSGQYDIDNIFTHHPPHTDQTKRYEYLQAMAKVMAWSILKFTPPSREQSLALTNLEQAIFWANASIARNEPFSAATPEHSNG